MFAKIESYAGTSWGTHIPDAYVKFVEHSGARVIPIIYKHHSINDAKAIMEKINGVIFPGGSGDDEYEVWEKEIFLKALALNDEGKVFPVMGICLGM